MKLRNATIDDAQLLLAWRNDPVTRANSLNTEIITPANHLRWLSITIKNARRQLLIAEERNIAVGTVSIEKNKNKSYEISWTVAPEHRGKGIGKKMVAAVIRAYDVSKLHATIKSSNIASIRIAEQLHIPYSLDSSRLRITLLLDNPSSWYAPYAESLRVELARHHDVSLVHSPTDISPGDCAFFLSCEGIIKKNILDRNRHNLVIHSSPLPSGKGWSPLTWQILEGKNDITNTLFEAVERVDAGSIYFQDVMHFEGHELLEELHKIQGESVNRLALRFVAEYFSLRGRAQEGKESFYPRRSAADSRLDPSGTIAKQFDLFRIADNGKYPVFFDHRGHRYVLKIYKTEK